MGKKNVVWNDYISNNERFADFMNGVIFCGEQLVRPEALTALDTKLRRRERGRDSYHEFIRDLAKLWEYRGKEICPRLGAGGIAEPRAAGEVYEL